MIITKKRVFDNFFTFSLVFFTVTYVKPLKNPRKYKNGSVNVILFNTHLSDYCVGFPGDYDKIKTIVKSNYFIFFH